MKQLRLLIGTLVTVGLLAVLAVSPAYAPPPFDPPGLDRAIEAQERHTDNLLGIQGVVGTAVGLGADGEPVIKIYTERSGIGGLPRSLDGIPVVVQVTGKIIAFHHRTTHCDGPPGSVLDDSCFKPTADDVSVTTPVDTAVDIILSGSDGETCDLTFAIVIPPVNGNLGDPNPIITDQACTLGDPNTDTAEVTYTPDTGFNGTDSFTYTTFDGVDTSDPATVTITVGTVIDLTEKFVRPVPLGVSSGNEESVATRGRFLICFGGTYGARVVDDKGTSKLNDDIFYALSNNHIYAEENSATIGSNILQPGLLDTNCVADPDPIATLSAFVPIVFSRRADNTVDAAIAESLTDNGDPLVDNSTPNDGYGTPNSAILACTGDCSNLLNVPVQKYGRTTSLTKGTITGVNATVIVRYDSGQARFDGQIEVGGSGFSASGDSGSLIVTDDVDANPVALLFAGSDTVTFGNPIDLVLSELSAELNLPVDKDLQIDGKE